MQARKPSLRSDANGAAAAELALSLPLLLTLLFGAAEAGFYFYNEHQLIESLRDGGRYASRQSFIDYPCGGTINTTTEANIKKVIRTGSATGTVNRIPLIEDSDITISYTCIDELETMPASTSFVPLGGIYEAAGEGAVLTISATVTYQSLFGFEYGFPSGGININAVQQAPVTGI